MFIADYSKQYKWYSEKAVKYSPTINYPVIEDSLIIGKAKMLMNIYKCNFHKHSETNVNSDTDNSWDIYPLLEAGKLINKEEVELKVQLEKCSNESFSLCSFYGTNSSCDSEFNKDGKSDTNEKTFLY